MDVMTHRTRQAPYRTVAVIAETPSHVSFRSAETVTLPRELFDESYVAVRERPFIPRDELEAIVESGDELVALFRDEELGNAAAGANRVLDKVRAVLAKVAK